MDVNYYKKYEPIDGKWYISKELGSGAFGKVFEIERKDFTTVKSALKIITIPSSQSEVASYREENYDLDEKSISSYFYGFVEEFTKEFELMLQLKGNSNIVSIEDYDVKKHADEIGWDIFIRMELLVPINSHFMNNTPTTNDIIKLGIDICKALELCQRYNIVHRDIKPSNIFISDTGEYKLGDFGVARTLEKTSSGLSKKGTYTYMAPEVFKNDVYGANVDIYSLGIVMYKLLNKNMEPFRTERTHSDEEKALEMRMRGENIPAPFCADAGLAEIILKACSYEPKDRYKSPLQMREELENLLCKDGKKNQTKFDEEKNLTDDVVDVEDSETVGLFCKKNIELSDENCEIDRFFKQFSEQTTVSGEPADKEDSSLFNDVAELNFYEIQNINTKLSELSPDELREKKEVAEKVLTDGEISLKEKAISKHILYYFEQRVSSPNDEEFADELTRGIFDEALSKDDEVNKKTIVEEEAFEASGKSSATGILITCGIILLLCLAFVWRSNHTPLVSITEANVIIESLVAGENLGELEISSDNPEQYRAVLDYCYYYDSNTGGYIHMTDTDVFEHGLEYFIRFMIIPNSGYCLEETTIYKANGQETNCYGVDESGNDSKREFVLNALDNDATEVVEYETPYWFVPGKCVINQNKLVYANSAEHRTDVFLFTFDDYGIISEVFTNWIFNTPELAENYFYQWQNDGWCVGGIEYTDATLSDNVIVGTIENHDSLGKHVSEIYSWAEKIHFEDSTLGGYVNLEGWNVPYKVFDMPIEYCAEFEYYLSIHSVIDGNPYEEWAIYIRTLSGEWVKTGEINCELENGNDNAVHQFTGTANVAFENCSFDAIAVVRKGVETSNHEYDFNIMTTVGWAH